MTTPDLEERSKEIEDSLRSVGVYVDSMRWINPNEEMEDEVPEDGDTLAGDASDTDEDKARKGKKSAYFLMVSADIGDVAFSSRVQDPDQYDMDAEFRVMQNEFKKAEYEEKQGSISDDLDKLMGH